MGRSRQRKLERRDEGTGHVRSEPARRPERTDVRRAPDSRSLVLGAALFVMTVVAYVPSIRGGFIWDDNLWITGNASLRTTEGLRRIWLEPLSTPQYYPLVLTTFWVEHHLWGEEPLPYHLANVLVHAASAVVLWQVLALLAVPGAWVAAAVFALHPVQVESVAWITERKNVLSGLFYLLAALSYLRFAPPDGPLPARPRWWRYAVAAVLFVCALLSKTVTASLPAALLLVLWWRRPALGWRDAAPLGPLLALGAAFGLTTAWIERQHVGAVGAEWAFTPIDRCLIAGRALWFYAAKLLWPHPLVFVYPRWRIDAGAWWQYLFPVGVVAVVAGLWVLRKRLGKAPLAAVLFFAVTLFPALGFVNVFPMRFSFVADHFQYLASIGPIALGVGVAANALGRHAGWRRASPFAAGVVLSVLAASSWTQGYVYRDRETLFRDTLARNPDAWMAHNNLGQVLERQGKTAEALQHFSEALRLFPTYPEGHNNAGAMHERLGQTAAALEHYQEAVRLLPDYADAQYNLGRLLAQQGDTDGAIVHLSETIRLRPGFPAAQRNLARALAERGRSEDAIRHYREAARLDPGNTDGRLALGRLLERQGRIADAIDEYTAALRTNPRLGEARGRLEALRARAGGG